MTRASVLEATPPRFSPDEIAAIAAELFGLSGRAIDLGSERDQTFLIEGAEGDGVLKISNLAEDQAVVELEAAAIAHVLRVDPELPLARQVAVGTWDGHLVRLFERRSGETSRGAELGDPAVRELAATHARLNLALRGFFHPAAGRELLWNLAHAPKLRQLLAAIDGDERRALVEAVLERFETRVAPCWPELRAQVVHGDFTADNVLFDDDQRVTGIVDFGDLGHSAQIADFAVGLASVLRGRTGMDVYRTARVAIDGYTARIPLDDIELALLGDLVAARLATLVTISAWRVERYPENAEYIQAWDDDSWALLDQFVANGWERVSYELGAARLPEQTQALARRRQRALGPALTDLTYREPVHVVSAEGVWLIDAAGRRLLDAYNNVPVVGHCHPRVTEAVVRQTRLVNTHARYLYEPLVELAERLVASMPPGSSLDTVMLVNSGSEANDLAWRIAAAHTGRNGGIVTAHAYHGVSAAIADLSPEEWVGDFRPPNVRTIDPRRSAVEEMRGALDGFELAATFLDAGLTSDGILTPFGAELREIARATRAAGGLFVADEVQVGHGRSGENLWAFAHYGLEPDIVTLGKPMGNGYPVAAVIARREVVESFAATTDFFSTFGGNPVAACAALAVLDVIADERLVEHAGRVGSRLLEQLRRLEHPAVKDVRGLGLLVGVELTDGDLARGVVDRLRDRGVLIGRTGPTENVLKIRPPLVFADEHVDRLVSLLDEELAAGTG